MKFVSQINPDDDLLDEYLHSLLMFRHCLNRVEKGPLGQLKHGSAAASQFGSWLIHEVPERDMSAKVVFMKKIDLELDEMQEQFLWLMRVFWEDNQDLFLCGETSVVDELDNRAVRTWSGYDDLHLYRTHPIRSRCRHHSYRVIKYLPSLNTEIEHFSVERDEELNHEYA